MHLVPAVARELGGSRRGYPHFRGNRVCARGGGAKGLGAVDLPFEFGPWCFDFEGLMVLLSAAVKGLLPFLHCFDPGGHSGNFCLFPVAKERRDSKSTV